MQAISTRDSKSINWSTVIMCALGFWLSGSLVLDCLIVPGMLTTGMMNEPGFASAGYVMFGAFNHIELLCAATILTGCLVYRFADCFNQRVSFKTVLTAAALLAIALVYTYIFTPQMSSAGMPLDVFATAKAASASMTVMHLVYWSLEATKLVFAALLLRTFFRKSCSLA